MLLEAVTMTTESSRKGVIALSRMMDP